MIYWHDSKFTVHKFILGENFPSHLPASQLPSEDATMLPVPCVSFQKCLVFTSKYIHIHTYIHFPFFHIKGSIFYTLFCALLYLLSNSHTSALFECFYSYMYGHSSFNQSLVIDAQALSGAIINITVMKKLPHTPFHLCISALGRFLEKNCWVKS